MASSRHLVLVIFDKLPLHSNVYLIYKTLSIIFLTNILSLVSPLYTHFSKMKTNLLFPLSTISCKHIHEVFIYLYLFCFMSNYLIFNEPLYSYYQNLFIYLYIVRHLVVSNFEILNAASYENTRKSSFVIICLLFIFWKCLGIELMHNTKSICLFF